jgi:hypothetical protein
VSGPRRCGRTLPLRWDSAPRPTFGALGDEWLDGVERGRIGRRRGRGKPYLNVQPRFVALDDDEIAGRELTTAEPERVRSEPPEPGQLGTREQG